MIGSIAHSENVGMLRIALVIDGDAVSALLRERGAPTANIRSTAMCLVICVSLDTPGTQAPVTLGT